MIKKEVLSRIKEKIKKDPCIKAVTIQHHKSVRSICPFCIDSDLQAKRVDSNISSSYLVTYYLDFFMRIKVCLDTWHLKDEHIKHVFVNQKQKQFEMEKELKDYRLKVIQ